MKALDRAKSQARKMKMRRWKSRCSTRIICGANASSYKKNRKRGRRESAGDGRRILRNGVAVFLDPEPCVNLGMRARRGVTGLRFACRHVQLFVVPMLL